MAKCYRCNSELDPATEWAVMLDDKTVKVCTYECMQALVRELGLSATLYVHDEPTSDERDDV